MTRSVNYVRTLVVQGKAFPMLSLPDNSITPPVLLRYGVSFADNIKIEVQVNIRVGSKGMTAERTEAARALLAKLKEELDNDSR